MTPAIKAGLLRCARAIPELLPAYHRARGRQRFLNVYLDTTNSCNLWCRMCYARLRPKSHRMQAWPQAQFERVAAQVLPHARLLMLSCATEPLLNPRMERCVRYAKRLGTPCVGLVTNGILLTPERSRGLIAAGLDRLVVSMDGARAETYEAIRTGAKFDRLMENLRALQAAKQAAGAKKPRLTFNYVILRSNLGEIEPFIDLAASLGAAAMDFRHLVIAHPGLDLEAEILRSDEIDATALARRIRERCAARGLDVEHAPDPQAASTAAPCAHPREMVLIVWNGDVWPCAMWKEEALGNVFRQDFWDIWNCERYRQLRESVAADCAPAPCRQCDRWGQDTLA